MLGSHWRRRAVHVEVAPGAELILGDGCVLGPRTRVLVRGGRVEIGAGAVLGERCTIVAHESVLIGEGAVLGDGAVVMDFEPGLGDVEQPIRAQALRTSPVVIEAGARIGLRACVLRGAHVASGTEVAAGEVAASPTCP